MRTLFICTESPFTKRDYERFGVSILREYYEVYILDFTPWLRPHVWNRYSSIVYDCPDYSLITGRTEFEAMLTKLSGSIAIDYLGNCNKSEWIRKNLSQFNIVRVRVQNGLLPAVSHYKTVFHHLKVIITQPHRWFSVLRKVMMSVPGRRLNIPDIVLLGGAAGLLDCATRSAKVCIPAHSFDYDTYLSRRGIRETQNSRYAVFLDEDMIYHSDYYHSGLKPPASEHKYYSSLDKYFDYFEIQTGLQIIVAAHPSSRYDLRPHLLKYRPCIIGKTAELVQYSELVLLHASTSQSFAVLWKKPMVFLTSNELESSWFGPVIKHRASLFNKHPINMCESDIISMNCREYYKIDYQLYSEYVKQYLKMAKSPNLPLWNIFIKYIKENNL